MRVGLKMSELFNGSHLDSIYYMAIINRGYLFLN